MCGLKEIFEGAGNFCDKKVPCKSHFSIREKLNLIRFIKTLYKNLFPSSVTAKAVPPSPLGRRLRDPSVRLMPATLHFRDGFRVGFQFGNFIFNLKIP